MSSDITLQGKQSELITNLFEKGIFDKSSGNAGVFFLATLIGIFESQIGEADSGGKEVNISRTYLAKSDRANFRFVLNTFENLEKKFNGVDQSMTQIFLDEEALNDSEKFQSVKNHGYAGLEILNNNFFADNTIIDALDIVTLIEGDLLTTEELDDIEITSSPVTIDSIDDLLKGTI